MYATLKLTNICKQCYGSYWCTLGVAYTLSGSLFQNCSYSLFPHTADMDVLAYLEAKQQSQDRLRESELDLKEKELELQTARFKLERGAGNSVEARDDGAHGHTAVPHGS